MVHGQAPPPNRAKSTGTHLHVTTHVHQVGCEQLDATTIFQNGTRIQKYRNDALIEQTEAHVVVGLLLLLFLLLCGQSERGSCMARDATHLLLGLLGGRSATGSSGGTTSSGRRSGTAAADVAEEVLDVLALERLSRRQH